MRIATSESQVDNESDDYLIELIGLKQDFPDEALEAYGKIYSRYWNVMFTIAKGVTRDEDVACDLLADTFNMVNNKASTFKKGKMNNPANIRLSIQKWMTTIMQRIFYDHYLDDAYKNADDNEDVTTFYIEDKKLLGKYINDDYNSFIEQLELSERNDNSEVSEIDREDSENLLKVKEYIGRLPERERDIILTIYDHYIPGKYTPAQVLNDLVIKWATTRENIRKILEKFRRAIKEDLQAVILIRK